MQEAMITIYNKIYIKTTVTLRNLQLEIEGDVLFHVKYIIFDIKRQLNNLLLIDS